MKTIFPNAITKDGSLYSGRLLVTHGVTVTDNGLTLIIGSTEHNLTDLDWDAENKIIEPHMDSDKVSPWHIAY